MRLIYVIKDNGDGSQSPLFFETTAKAREFIATYEGEIIPEGVEVQPFDVTTDGVLRPWSGFNE